MCLHFTLILFSQCMSNSAILTQFANKPNFHWFLASMAITFRFLASQLLQRHHRYYNFYAIFLCLCSIVIYRKSNRTKYNKSPKYRGENRSFLGSHISHNILFSSKIILIHMTDILIEAGLVCEKQEGRKEVHRKERWSITQWVDLPADPVMYAAKDVPSE